MRRGMVLAAAAALACAVSVGAAGRGSAPPAAFQVRISASLAVPPGAKRARIWLALPRDESPQSRGEVRLTGPGGSVATGEGYENSYACFDVANPPAALAVAAECRVERKETRVLDDPAAAARGAEPLNDRSLRFYADQLKAESGVPVGGPFAALAAEITAGEKNPVLQARRLFDWITTTIALAPRPAGAARHGDSARCLAEKSGDAADLHALFASLARSLNVPVRLVYGARPGGEGAAAATHCWAECYALGVGWIPLDLAEARRAPKEARAPWFGGLDARRVTLSLGRDLELAPRQEAGPVPGVWDAYAEIDGRPAPVTAQVSLGQ